MRYYVVTTTEYSGYDCGGHRVKYIVAANSTEEANNMLPVEPWNDSNEVKELILPSLDRKRKAFILE